MILNGITLYYDTPYTIGGHHVPNIYADDCGTVLKEFHNVKSSHDNMFVLDLPIPYAEAMHPWKAPTYIRVSYQPETGQNAILYGWITGIEEIAGNSKATRIRWESDYWRSYQSLAEFGHGHILRCPESSVDRSQMLYDNYNPGLGQRQDWYTTLNRILDVPSGIHETDEYQTRRWVVALVNTSSGGDTILDCFFWPEGSRIYPQFPQPTQNQPTISLDAIYDGMLTEYMNIQADAVIGAWMLPFCPFKTGLNCFEISSSQGMAWYKDSSASFQVVTRQGTDGVTRGFFLGSISDFSKYGNPTCSIPQSVPGHQAPNVRTTKTNVQLTDCSGQLIWKRPWNGNLVENFTKLSITWALDGLSIYMYVFEQSDDYQTAIWSPVEYAARGELAVIPMPRLPVNNNAWQSYNLSGQRDLEIIQAKTAVESGIVKSAAGSVTGAAEGALTGALVGAAGGPIGAGAGQIIGLAGSLISTAVGGAVDISARERVQKATDRAVANTASSLILSGDSQLAASEIGLPKLVVLVSVGTDYREQDKQQNGWYVDETVDINTINIRSEGPWQIEGLEVIGPVPPAAREAIKQMYAAGIYINPL